MSPWWLLVAACVLAAFALARPDPVRRLAAVVPSATGPAPPATLDVETSAALAAVDDRLSPLVCRAAAAAAGLTVLLVLPGKAGALFSGLSVVATYRWLARQPRRDRASDGSAVRRQLPLVLDLMAAALRSGATTSAAVTLAADATGPPADRTLREVVGALLLGAGAEEAWRPALREPSLERLARLAVRSDASGAALAGACHDLARAARAQRLVEAHAAAKRAGVLAVLPLALCFLPAFVLVGVVPLVVGLLQSLPL